LCSGPIGAGGGGGDNYVPLSRRSVVVQDGYKSLWIATKHEQSLNIGDPATASGNPTIRNGVLILAAAEAENGHKILALTVTASIC